MPTSFKGVKLDTKSMCCGIFTCVLYNHVLFGRQHCCTRVVLVILLTFFALKTKTIVEGEIYIYTLLSFKNLAIQLNCVKTLQSGYGYKNYKSQKL